MRRFFSRLLLQKSPTFDEFGTPTTYMSLALLVSWILICVCIFRGVQSSGKVSALSSIVYSYLRIVLGGLFHGYFSVYRSSCTHYFFCNTQRSW